MWTGSDSVQIDGHLENFVELLESQSVLTQSKRPQRLTVEKINKLTGGKTSEQPYHLKGR
jgi:hypothetical protein